MHCNDASPLRVGEWALRFRLQSTKQRRNRLGAEIKERKSNQMETNVDLKQILF